MNKQYSAHALLAQAQASYKKIEDGPVLSPPGDEPRSPDSSRSCLSARSTGSSRSPRSSRSPDMRSPQMDRPELTSPEALSRLPEVKFDSDSDDAESESGEFPYITETCV